MLQFNTLNSIDIFAEQQIEDLVRQGRFEYFIAEKLLDEYAYPDLILEVSNEIKTTSLPNKDFKSILEDTTNSVSDSEAPSLIAGVLGVTKSQTKKFLRDPKTASVLFRSLRDKLEDMHFKKERAKAEEHGFIATVIYSIKRAMYWLMKKFTDLKDSFLDLAHDNPYKATQTRRDYDWLMDKQRDYFANNTDWYNAY